MHTVEIRLTIQNDKRFYKMSLKINDGIISMEN